MSYDPELVFYCAITGAMFFLLGLLLGRRWKTSSGAPRFNRKPDFRKPAFPVKAQPPRKDGPVEIYVGNLSLEVTKEDVEKEFSRFGKVQNIRLITKHGESKSFGFVEMAVPGEAEEAIKALAGKDFKGSPLEVNIAKSPRGHRRHHRR
jgi:RNA recognition motif-containing protein